MSAMAMVETNSKLYSYQVMFQYQQLPALTYFTPGQQAADKKKMPSQLPIAIENGETLSLFNCPKAVCESAITNNRLVHGAVDLRCRSKYTCKYKFNIPVIMTLGEAGVL